MNILDRLDARLDVTPERFGAVGSAAGTVPTVDETAAMQAWVDYLRTNSAKGRLPARSYLVSSLDMFPSGGYTIEGDSLRNSRIYVSNTARAGVGLRFTHPSNPMTRGQPYLLRNFSVYAASGTKACLVEHRNASDAKWGDVEVLGYHAASCVRLTGLFNCDFSRVQVWGGGHNVPYKDTGTLTFSITSGDNTLTSSAAHFAAGDVGRKITLGQSGAIASTFTIASFTSTAEVEVTEAAALTYSAVRATWGGVRGSMTAGSPTLTLEADRLTADDVGRTVYVIGAGPTDASAVRPLRAAITEVSGTAVTLSINATSSVTNGDIVFDPAADMGLVEGEAPTNDARFSNLMVEEHRGCGLVASGTKLDFRDIKLHSVGYNIAGQNATATNIQGLFYFYSGLVDGTFESTLASNLGRVVITGQNAQQAMFGDLITIGVHNQRLFFGLLNRSTGVVTSVGSVGVINSGLTPALISGLFGGDSTALWHQRGAITGYNLAARVIDYSTAFQEFADDAAASSGGIPVGGQYRTGSAIKVRVA